MASSTSYPLSVMPQELNDLFSWNPPQLDSLPDKKMSITTRPAGFFDKHFSEELKLLHVKRLPSLVHDITAIVDKTIIESLKSGVQFPPSNKFYSAENISRAMENLDEEMADENAVASFYERTTATFCAPVASTLALGAPGLLMWTQSANVSGYAIADGFLKFASPKALAKRIAQLEGVMDKEILVRLARRSSLTTHRITNLAAGGCDVMLAISNLSNSPTFDWTSCNTPLCASLTKHQKGHEKVAAVIMGPDATSTPWSFDSSSNNSDLEARENAAQPQRPTHSQPRHIPLASTSAQLPDSVPPLALPAGSFNVRTKKAQKRKRGHGSDSESTRFYRRQNPKAPAAEGVPGWLQLPSLCRSYQQPGRGLRNRSRRILSASRHLSPPPVRGVEVEAAFPRKLGKGKGKEAVEGKVQAGGNADQNDNDEAVHDASYKDNDDLSAKCIVQQAWAQATRVDASIIVLHSGNHEFIGVRNRSNQTLYISDLVKPYACQPSYGKLHVGIYIAAIKDAINRERQAHDAWSPDGAGDDGIECCQNGGSPGNGDRGNDHDGPHAKDGRIDPKEGSGRPKDWGNQRGRTVESIAKGLANEMAKKNTLKLVSSRHVILLYLQYGIYDSPAPSTFVRSGPIGQAPIPLPSQETVRNYRLEECLTIVLKSEIGHGATGVVLRGTLEVEASACVSLDVAVKLAYTSEGINALRKEYTIYRRLKSSGVTTGITTPLGLFYDVEGGACALVMPYVGISLAAMPELVLPISSQEAILAILGVIHHAHILHGDLRLDNILSADSGFTIIDFGRSRVCHDEDAKSSECLQLRTLLDQSRPGTSRVLREGLIVP